MMDSSNPKPPSKNDIELKEKRVDAEVHAHQRTDNLAVLIADNTAASLTKCLVDNR